MGRFVEGFIEVNSCQQPKHGQLISGDVFLSKEVKEEGRIISVLSDGLGNGVKANVLATITATMALKFTASPMDTLESAEILINALPRCSERKTSYSTFSIVDMANTGETRIIEYGNPPCLLVRPSSAVDVERTELHLRRWQDRVIRVSHFSAQREDRIILVSNGITQAGLGQPDTAAGWGIENVDRFIREQIHGKPSISGRELSQAVAAQANEVDARAAKDDMTCGVVYLRSPRQLLVLTGPPYNRAHDRNLALLAECTPGRKVICGGTTANIISQRLNRPVELDPDSPRTGRLPAPSRMEGFDLVTEGALTLSEVRRLLEQETPLEGLPPNAAVRLLTMLLDSDIVKFAVGTRINEDLYDDPTFPVELDIRRNIVKRIAHLLESKHLKRTYIEYL